MTANRIILGDRELDPDRAASAPALAENHANGIRSSRSSRPKALVNHPRIERSRRLSLRRRSCLARPKRCSSLWDHGPRQRVPGRGAAKHGLASSERPFETERGRVSRSVGHRLKVAFGGRDHRPERSQSSRRTCGGRRSGSLVWSLGSPSQVGGSHAHARAKRNAKPPIRSSVAGGRRRAWRARWRRSGRSRSRRLGTQ